MAPDTLRWHAAVGSNALRWCNAASLTPRVARDTPRWRNTSSLTPRVAPDAPLLSTALPLTRRSWDDAPRVPDLPETAKNPYIYRGLAFYPVFTQRVNLTRCSVVSYTESDRNTLTRCDNSIVHLTRPLSAVCDGAARLGRCFRVLCQGGSLARY